MNGFEFDSVENFILFFTKDLGKMWLKKDVFISIQWEDSFVRKLEGFREGKKNLRIEKYLKKEELLRFINFCKEKKKGIIRFGGNKEKERGGDFCLIGGVYTNSTFYSYYRSLEISFESVFDLILFNYIFNKASIKPKKIIIFSPKVFCSNRPGRMNYVLKMKEKLDLK